MVRLKTMAFGALTLALGMAGSSPALAKAVSGPSTLVIGVDHTDPANQDQAAHRWFEYTDFFSRDVRVHSGEVLDFRFAPGELGHTVGLGPNAETPRLVYPLASVDTGDVPATGSGAPKLVLGAGNFAITNGSTSGGGTIGQDPTGGDRPCGVAPLPVCHFRGGNDIEDSGPIFGTDAQDNPVTVDWKISVDAAPGDYAFLCWFHAGMQGTLHVVDASAPATSQAENDFRGNIQFVTDRADATAAEAAYNFPRFSGGLPGRRTYDVTVGVSAANLHANVLEMLPQHLDLVDGDKVTYSWKQARNEAHTVTFPANSPNQPGLALFDCGATVSPIFAPPCIDPVDHHPEPIFDPGFNPSGSPLTNPAALIDSGVLLGPAEAAAYHLSPTAQQWSVTTNAATQAGTYTYQCQIHDVMVGSLTIRR